MSLLESISRNIYKLDAKSMRNAEKEWDDRIHPPKSLGALEDIVIKLAGVYNTHIIENNPKKCIIAFGADHGVHEEGISELPQEITRMQMENFANGNCAISVLAKANNTDLVTVDVGIKGKDPIYGVWDYKIRESTNNITKGSAMTRAEAIKSIEYGIEIAERCIVDGYKIIGIGEMGICNTTPSTAIISVITGINPKYLTDIGSGISEEKLNKKISVIEKAISINNPNPTDGVEILSKIGGFEIGAMCGVIIGCAANKIPVVLDGFISYASALIAYRINPKSVDYLLPSHKSAEKGTEEVMKFLSMKPLLDMNMRLGEGTGSALAMGIIDSAIKTYNEMGKFSKLPIGKVLENWTV